MAVVTTVAITMAMAIVTTTLTGAITTRRPATITMIVVRVITTRRRRAMCRRRRPATITGISSTIAMATSVINNPGMTIAVTRSVRSIVAGRFNNVAGIQAAVPSYAFPMVASTTTSAVAGKIHDDLHAACPPLSCAYPS